MTIQSEAAPGLSRRADVRGIRGLITRHPLTAFFVLANALSWTAWLPYILSNHGLGVWDATFPEFLGGSQIIGVLPGAYLGPITSALLITALVDGKAGLRRWAGRLFRWRAGLRWYLLALLGVPAIMIAGAFAFTGGVVQAPSLAALSMVIPGLILQFLTTGLAEEPGWRDFALPRLQHRMSPLKASFVLGPLWALWHMPLFLTEWGGFPNADIWRIVTFVGFCIAFNIVMSWVFNRTRQSLPLSMLLHVGVNNTASVLLPDMFPTLTVGIASWMLFLLASVAAVAIVAATRGRLGLDADGARLAQ